MKISNSIVILITLILSAGYIFGIDYYDKQDTKIKTLYEAIRLPQITYSQISIELSGIKEREKLAIRDIAKKQQQSITEFSHSFGCSKFCTQIHRNDADTEFIKEKDVIGVFSESTDKTKPFSILIKNQKSIHYNTYYKIKIQGIHDINELDNLRNRSYNLFMKWHVKGKESLAFRGQIEGRLTASQKKAYVMQLFKELKASERAHYLDDCSKETEAYYGYTKKIKEYIIDAKGKKSNLQISFSYNEKEETTQVIIAFPFYNEPF